MADGSSSGPASRPPPPPKDPYDSTTFGWWITAHQRIIKKLLDGTPHKVKYYGGFALNLALGCDTLPSSPLKLAKCYSDGSDIIGEYASDIDAKILGVTENERKFVEDRLEAASGGLKATSLPDDIRTALLRTAELPSDNIYIIETVKFHGGDTIYICGYNKGYISDRMSRSQLILIGVYRDRDNVWRSQVLSELTPQPEEAPADAPLFMTTDLPTLRQQFVELLTFLEGRPAGKKNSRREAKTRIRIGTINARRRGGGRRSRSRRHQTRRLLKRGA